MLGGFSRLLQNNKSQGKAPPAWAPEAQHPPLPWEMEEKKNPPKKQYDFFPFSFIPKWKGKAINIYGLKVPETGCRQGLPPPGPSEDFSCSHHKSHDEPLSQAAQPKNNGREPRDTELAAKPLLSTSRERHQPAAIRSWRG